MMSYSALDDTDNIDLIEQIVKKYNWEYNRINDNQITMVAQGQWRTYSITLAWSAHDQTLRLICTFEIEPQAQRIEELYKCLNLANDRCWVGAFTYVEDKKLLVYRYGLILTGEKIVSPDQINKIIDIAVMSTERFYPAFQLISSSDQTPEQALQVAITKAYGHA